MKKNETREPAVRSPINKTANGEIGGSKVILRSKRLTDVRNDYNWETDPELIQLDAASPLDITFNQYQSDYASLLRCIPSNRRQFAIETFDGKHIGNCSYYDINEAKSETELGIMIGDRDYWNKGYGTDVVTTLVRHIFRNSDLKRVYLKTLDLNGRAQKCFQKCGFTSYGHTNRNGFNFTLMEIHRNQWQESQAKA